MVSSGYSHCFINKLLLKCKYTIKSFSLRTINPQDKAANPLWDKWITRNISPESAYRAECWDYNMWYTNEKKELWWKRIWSELEKLLGRMMFIIFCIIPLDYNSVVPKCKGKWNFALTCLPKGSFFSSSFKLEKLICYKSHTGMFLQGRILFFEWYPRYVFLKSFYKYIFLMKP